MWKINWMESFMIGHPELDADHQEIVATANRIGEALSQGDRAACSVHADHLIKVAEAHYAREEALLKASEFPDFYEHRAFHRLMFVEIQALCKSIVSSSGDCDADLCFERMAKFVIDDLLRGDMNFKSHLQDAGLAEAPYPGALTGRKT